MTKMRPVTLSRTLNRSRNPIIVDRPLRFDVLGLLTKDAAVRPVLVRDFDEMSWNAPAAAAALVELKAVEALPMLRETLRGMDPQHRSRGAVLDAIAALEKASDD